MSSNLKVRLVELQKEFADIFAWSYRDMPCLDRGIVEYKLPLLLDSVPVRQQLRRMKPEVALKIKEEIEKQCNAGFLTIANYPQWVKNIVPVPKKDKKVMSFELKNADTTYQRAMVALFHDMMHKEIEVYVDDMIAKSKTPEQHIELRLNPTKCTFDVKTEKLLDFEVNERGIEVDPDKKLKWDSKCQKAFEKIKQYLENPPVLVLVIPRKPLILYLTVLEESIGCVLGQKDTSRKKEQAIDYLSK
ncbi:hypothetical protein CR513_19416, partial [Mucuna pruriens]